MTSVDSAAHPKSQALSVTTGGGVIVPDPANAACQGRPLVTNTCPGGAPAEIEPSTLSRSRAVTFTIGPSTGWLPHVTTDAPGSTMTRQPQRGERSPPKELHPPVRSRACTTDPARIRSVRPALIDSCGAPKMPLG